MERGETKRKGGITLVFLSKLSLASRTLACSIGPSPLSCSALLISSPSFSLVCLWWITLASAAFCAALDAALLSFMITSSSHDRILSMPESESISLSSAAKAVYASACAEPTAILLLVCFCFTRLVDDMNAFADLGLASALLVLVPVRAAMTHACIESSSVTPFSLSSLLFFLLAVSSQRSQRSQFVLFYKRRYIYVSRRTVE